MHNYTLSSICGCFYTGGKISFSNNGNSLFVPIGNRIGVYDLSSNQYNTFNSESRNDLRWIVLHPSMEYCICIDKFGYGCIISLLKDQIISRILFKSKTGVVTSFNYNSLLSPQEEQDSVNCASFTNNGKFFLIGIGRRVVIWKSPTRKNHYRLMKYNDICFHTLNVISMDISEDDLFFLTCSYDMTIRVHTVQKSRGIRPTVLGGNKSTIVGAYFLKGSKSICSINKSGLMLLWEFEEEDNVSGLQIFQKVANKKVFFCNQEKGEEVIRTALNRKKDLLVVAFTSGRFCLYNTPEMTSLYNISISTQSIDDIIINNDGEWIALAESEQGSVLVWEWKSESYVLKQSTTNKHVRCVKFSPMISHLTIGSQIGDTTNTSSHDSDNFSSKFVIATGNEDGSIKLYDYLSLINFVTFTVHSSSVTDLCFLPQGNAFLSCSLDGTVRAFDLMRYRNFRVFIPEAIKEDGIIGKGKHGVKEKEASRYINVQFLCVSTNVSGNIVAAGGRGQEFIVYIWNMQTGACIDKLYGHNAPICKICFSTNIKEEGLIATCSSDKQVLMWNLYGKSNKGSKYEELVNPNDISYICFDPRGNDQLAVCTLSCKILFWDVSAQEIVGTVEGERDIKRGQYIGDQISAIPQKKKRKLSKDKEEDIYVVEEEDGSHTVVNRNCYFTSAAYVHNGNFLMATANCSVSIYIYDTNLYLLVKIINLTRNFSVDGIKREISTRYITENGRHLFEFDLSDEEGDVWLDPHRVNARKKRDHLLPSQIEEHYVNNKFKKYKLLLHQIDISSDDRHIAVATNVGLYVFTKDFSYQYIPNATNSYKGLISPSTYTPKYLSQNVNLLNLKKAVVEKKYITAFILSLALNSYEHILEVYETIPYRMIPFCLRALSPPFVLILINFIKALLMNDTVKHIHLHLYYLNSIFTVHFSSLLNSNLGNSAFTKKGKNQSKGVIDKQIQTFVTSESRNSLLMILKHLFVLYNSLQYMYTNNINVLRYLCIQTYKKHV